MIDKIRFFREELLSLLNKGNVRVVFTKSDGSERTMVCTKRMDVIPTESHPKGQRPTNDYLCTVWDLEANGWRSFNFDKVISYEQVIEEVGIPN